MNSKTDQSITPQFFIGLMCGTSIDGVDVALVEFSDNQCRLVDSYLHPIEDEVKQKLRSLCSLSNKEIYLTNIEHRIELLGELDTRMGEIFADSVNEFIRLKHLDKRSIAAIGSHGQTIRHQPANKAPFTLQIGDPNLIAFRTGITTVADFRRMDIAAGGQGAPLAPAFHNAVMRSEGENRIILNLGGIANITLLPQDLNEPVIGFDTGTANTLLDVWYMQNHPDSGDDFDRDSAFALRGNLDQNLLVHLCDDPYFKLPPPKSTGREYFSLEWLWQKIKQVDKNLPPADVQRTLLEFTAVTIRDAINRLNLPNYQIYTCGGGSHNAFLIERLELHLERSVPATDSINISGDYLEAITFAWLAYCRINKIPGNLPSVTGARERKILGAVYIP